MEDTQIIRMYELRNEDAVMETSIKYQNYCYKILSDRLPCNHRPFYFASFEEENGCVTEQRHTHICENWLI